MLRFPRSYAIAIVLLAIVCATAFQFSLQLRRQTTAGSAEFALEGVACPNRFEGSDEREFALPSRKDKAVRDFFKEIKLLSEREEIPLLLLRAMTGTNKMAHEKYELDLEGLFEASRNLNYQLTEAEKSSEASDRSYAQLLQLQKDLNVTVVDLLREKLNVDIEQLYWTLAFAAPVAGGTSLVASLKDFLQEKIKFIDSVQARSEQFKVSENRSGLELVTRDDFNFLRTLDLHQLVVCPRDATSDEVLLRCGKFNRISFADASFQEYLAACHNKGFYGALTRMGMRRKSQMQNDTSLRSSRELTLCTKNERVQLSENAQSGCGPQN